MRYPILLAGFTALGACSPSGSSRSQGEALPSIPEGLLRDPAEWGSIPRPGREGCEPGTPCARSWDNIIAWASRWDDPKIFPDITDSIANHNDHDVVALACTLAWRGSDDENWRERARLLIEAAVHKPYFTTGVSALRPGRNLLSYVLAASTIDLSHLDGLLDADFRRWIEQVAEIDHWIGDGVDEPGTFRDYQEKRPNNIGLVVGASRMAVDMYLGGNVHARHLLDAEHVFRGFLGEDTAYLFSDESFGGARVNGDNSWQFDPQHKNGIDPVGARIPPGTGVDVDGCLPEEMRRLGEFDCASCGLKPSIRCYNRADRIDGGDPPGISATGYVWEALQGLVMQAYLLSRCGYDSFAWGDSAIERTHRFLYVTYGFRAQDTWNDPTQSDNPGCCNGGSDRNEVDDTWVPHIVKAIYDSSFLDGSNLVYGGRPGKNCGFADWWTLGLQGAVRAER